jgi:antitoxin (DNA-binding transcriptional repressor) of toxin-antitoxin stability system
MTTIDIDKAKQQFDELVERAGEGEIVVIERPGKPPVQLVLAGATQKRSRLGFLEGQIEVPEDYSDKEDPEILRLFGIE